MPRQTVWLVRASLLYLAAGISLGGLLLANKGIPFGLVLWTSLPSHIEFLLIGWLVQLAMGVAFWILPRFTGARPRGDERLVWLSFLLINAGIWLVAARPWLPPVWPAAAGRLLEAGAVLFYVVGSWRRVKPAGA